MQELGVHLHIELWECEPELLNQPQAVENALVEAAHSANCTVVNRVIHQFKPQGVSGVVVLAESHISVHTWPELGYAALDVFACGADCYPQKAAEHLIASFSAKKSTVKSFSRGIPEPSVHSVAKIA
jgi:S-adenosylmethionine decarboxylase